MTRNVYYRQEFFEVSATIVQRLRRILKGKPYATVHIRKVLSFT